MIFFTKHKLFFLLLFFGALVYSKFFLEILIFENFKFIYTFSKWHFIEPTYLTYSYFIISLLTFWLLCLILLIKKIKLPLYNFNLSQFYENKLLFIIFLGFLTYLFLNFFIFNFNWRIQSNPVAKFIMVISYSYLYSFILIMILNLKNFKNKKFLYAVLTFSILSLLIASTGAGSMFTIVGILIFFVLKIFDKKKSLFTNFYLIFFILIITFSMFYFFLIFYKFNNINFIDNKLYEFKWLSNWLVERLSVVGGSSIFLIENFYYDRPDFGLNNIKEIFLNNLNKLLGIGSIEIYYKSIGMYNWDLFYIGSRENLSTERSYGLSPGVFGGAIYFFEWTLAAILSGLIIFILIFFTIYFWGNYLHGFLLKLCFFIFFISFYFQNPYDYFTLINPGFIRYLIFSTSPVIFLILFKKFTRYDK